MPGRRIGRKVVLFGCVAALGAILAGAILWLFLPWLLTRVADRQLANLELEESALRVTRLGIRQAEVEAIVLADEGWRVEVAGVEAGYSPRRLWRERAADTLHLEGVTFMLDLDHWEALAADADAAGEEQDTLRLEWATSDFFPLPIDRVEISAGRLILTRDGEAIAFDMAGRIEAVSSDRVTALLELQRPGASVALEATLEREGDLEAALTMSFAEPLALLTGLLPAWEELAELPEELELALGTLEFQSELVADGKGKASLEGFLRTESLGLLYDEAIVESEAFALAVHLGADGVARGRVSAELKGFRYDDFSLPSQSVSLDYRSADLRQWRLVGSEPLRWDYDAGFIRGLAAAKELEISLFEEEEPLTLRGLVAFDAVEVSDYTLEPFDARFEGTLESIAFETEALVWQAYPSLRLVAGRGWVSLPETGPIQTLYEAQLPEDALASLDPGWTLAPIRVRVKADSGEVETRAEVELEAQPQGALIAGAGVEARGDWQARLVAESRDPEASWWDVDVTSVAEGIEVRGPTWSATGLAGEIRWRLPQLDTELFSAEEMDWRALSASLAETASGQLSFQLGEARLGEAILRWASGSFGLNERQEASAPLAWEAQFNAGSLETASERLQQLNLTADAQGDAASLAGQGALRFLFEGVDGKAQVDFELRGLASEGPELEGRYEAGPMIFDYSDLLSRRFEDLEGLSFSANLGASGRFRLNAAGFDATALATVENGSVSYPGAQIAAEGLRARVELESLMDLRGAPGASGITLDSLQLGDLSARDGSLRFDLSSPERLELREASLHALGGILALQSGTVDLQRLDYRGRARFDAISLAEISRTMGFFDGDMEGAISGFLPLNLVAGEFQLGEGRLGLAPGEVARLRYDAKGLLTGGEASEYAPPVKASLGDRILGWLGLKPEELVESSLSDFEISELSVRLFPEDTPETPLQIYFEGVGHAGEVDLPLVLQVNVNGGLEELYTFLIRLNSLGAPAVSAD